MPTWTLDISAPRALLALAQGDGATTPLETAGGFGWVLLKTALLLLAVCLLAYLVLRFGLARLTGAGARPSGRLVVLERLSLEPRRSLQVVRVGARVLLIGVGEGGIGLLCELDSEEWGESGVREARGAFKRALQRALSGADAERLRVEAAPKVSPPSAGAPEGTV